MFQITILDGKKAKLISAPEKLTSMLQYWHQSTEIIDIDLIPVIQNVFPAVTITRLSYKTESKKYYRSRKIINKKYNPGKKIGEMIEYLSFQDISSKEAEFLLRCIDYITECGALAKKMYAQLCKIYEKYNDN